MKKRKVGRALSLLLAVAMVVGVMLPASSVLANTVGTNFDDSKAIVVKNFSELKSALDNASTSEKTYIKLADTLDATTNSAGQTVYDTIKLATPYTHGSRGDSAVSYFVGEEFFVQSFWISRYDRNDWAWGERERYVWEATPIEDLMTIYNPAVFGNLTTDDVKWSVADETGWYHMPVTTQNVATLQNMFGFTEDKIGREYDSAVLIIPENTDVVLDLNGKKIVGSNNNATAYTGSPSYSAPVFQVDGSLTLLDRVGGGEVSGGTGYVLDSCAGKSFTRMRTHNNNTGGDGDSTYSNYHSNWTRNEAGTGYGPGWFAITGSDKVGNPVVGVTSAPTKTYYLRTHRCSYWYSDATEAHGGGVYVAPGATFNLEGGTITENCAWMLGYDTDEASIFQQDAPAVTKGGGVYVSGGATFNMSGGEITQNAARSYQKSNNTNNSYAYGGGVYLADGAVMNFTAGQISENATYAETWSSGSRTKNNVSQGAGVYISSGATLNMMGSAPAEGPTTDAMRATFPQVTNNAAGATIRKQGDLNTIQGAGIYNGGMLNIEKAIVSANEFGESSGTENVVSIIRDPDTGLPIKGGDEAAIRAALTVSHGASVANSYTLRADESGAPYATIALAHEASGKYTVQRDASASGAKEVRTEGAGVYNAVGATMNLGERTWVYDNWDLATNSHTARLTDGSGSVSNSSSRYYDTTNEKWVYLASGSGNLVSAGYRWDDTRDDVYLPDGMVINIASELFECKLGVNYVDMAAAAVSADVNKLGGGASRVFIAQGTNLPAVWGSRSFVPQMRDTQFFFVNDENNPSSGNALKTQHDLDYVVLYDTSPYGTEASPVLRFGVKTADNRNTYVTFNFAQAGKTFFVDRDAQSADTWLSTTPVIYERFTGAQDIAYSLSRLLIPDYIQYKGSNWATLAGEVGAADSLIRDADGETEDSYFKGWTFYASYGNYNLYQESNGTVGTTPVGRALVPQGSRIGSTSVASLGDTSKYWFYNYNLADATRYNDNFNYQYVPAFSASWYTAEELADARSRVSNVKAQRVVIGDGTKAIRFLALVDGRYAQYEEAGFVFSTSNATPTIEGGYDFSQKSKIYKKVLTKKSADDAGEWADVYYMMNPSLTPVGTLRVDWTEFQNAKGILYTNLIVEEGNEDIVYYATPYVKAGDTYYYGLSRAISYNWLVQQDNAAQS